MNKMAKALLIGGLALGGMAYANHRVSQSYRPMHGSVDGEPGSYVWRDGVVYYHVKGEGEPVVLTHSFHPFSSSRENQALYDSLAQSNRVYAMDWIGYGQSNRPTEVHTAGTFQQLLADFLEDVVKEPAMVVASGPGAAYAVRLARCQPDKVSRLVLINPTGVDELIGKPSYLQSLLGGLLRAPIVGDFIYNLITSLPALRWELTNRVFFIDHPPSAAQLDEAWVMAHQMGAKWAPLSLWSGKLNLCVAGDLVALEQPTLVAWGQQAKYAPIEGIQGYKRYLPNARYRAFDRTREWPQAEDARGFSALVHNWMTGQDHGAAAIFPGEVQPEPADN